MGTVILHAGMSKAGSSSIQRWLRDDARALRVAGWHVLVYRQGVDDLPGELTRWDRGNVNSGTLAETYLRSNRDPALLDEIFASLDRWATELGAVVLSGEGIAQFFAEADEQFLCRLDALAARHEIRVAYYVRAQHEALEAAWRQWGFRQSREPSAYIAVREQLLDYRDTRCRVRELLHNASFEMRLFHREALANTSIVEDFACTFLDFEEVPRGTAVWANPGLPLELANVLRHAGPGRFWLSSHDNAPKIGPIKDIVANWRIPESPAIRRSRLLLQHHCHQRFEDGNLEVARECGWPIDHLVPPVEDPDLDDHDLSELDLLWSTDMSPAELELMFQALETLVTGNRALRELWKRMASESDDVPSQLSRARSAVRRRGVVGAAMERVRRGARDLERRLR